jgi:hypothetical protein
VRDWYEPQSDLRNPAGPMRVLGRRGEICKIKIKLGPPGATRSAPDRLTHFSPTTSDGGIFPYVAPGPLMTSVLRRRKFVNYNTILLEITL